VLIGSKEIKRALAFRVFNKRQFAVSKTGQSLFTDSLKFEPQGDGWLLRGKAKNLDDWNLGQALLNQSKGKVENLSRLHPLERVRAESRIRGLLREAGMKEVEVRSAGNIILLSGFASSLPEKEFAEALAGQVFKNVRSQITVPIEQGARLRFHAKILEIVRSEATNIGLDWSQGVPGAILVGKGITKGNFSLEAGLKLLQMEGNARVLSQPELLLNEKGVAQLNVGGEIPVALKTKNSASVQWKPYGLSLRLELPGVSRNLARTRITVEISSLDKTLMVEGIPGLRVSKMDTQVDMEIGKPVLLSGLMERRENSGHSGLPFLGDIPVLGELFRSRDFQENRSELVIFLEAERR
jgi:pilus assembly protein CpaC